MRKFLTMTTIGCFAVLLQPTWAELVFDHETHLEQDLQCGDCHETVPPGPNWEAPMPARDTCLDCHDDEDLPPLPPHPSSHQENYRWQHQFAARADGNDDCTLCHRNSEKCTVCHHGENVDFIVHDRNWRFTHPLTFYKGTEECTVCHDVRKFCQDCHTAYGARPVNHYFSQWPSPQYHGAEARVDLTTCLQCHDGPDPVCRTCHGEP